MIRRRLARPKSAYFDEVVPARDSPEALFAWIPVGPNTSAIVLLMRHAIVDTDTGREVVFKPYPNIQLFNGKMSFRPPELEFMQLHLTWSDYLKVLKRRKGKTPEQQGELITVSSESDVVTPMIQKLTAAIRTP